MSFMMVREKKETYHLLRKNIASLEVFSEWNAHCDHRFQRYACKVILRNPRVKFSNLVKPTSHFFSKGAQLPFLWNCFIHCRMLIILGPWALNGNSRLQPPRRLCDNPVWSYSFPNNSFKSGSSWCWEPLDLICPYFIQPMLQLLPYFISF